MEPSFLATLLTVLIGTGTGPWPQLELGGAATLREGNWGYRIEAGRWFKAGPNGFGLSGEWSQDALVSAYAGTARYRLGTDHFGIWPLAGWRGRLNGLTGPELGIGAELGFGPGTAWLRAEGGAIVGLDGTIGSGLRVASTYRVLKPLELEASYRLENWGAWSQVWDLGASLAF